jgi:hypothetical protein
MAVAAGNMADTAASDKTARTAEIRTETRGIFTVSAPYWLLRVVHDNGAVATSDDATSL